MKKRLTKTHGLAEFVLSRQIFKHSCNTPSFLLRLHNNNKKTRLFKICLKKFIPRVHELANFIFVEFRNILNNLFFFLIFSISSLHLPSFVCLWSCPFASHLILPYGPPLSLTYSYSPVILKPLFFLSCLFTSSSSQHTHEYLSLMSRL